MMKTLLKPERIAAIIALLAVLGNIANIGGSLDAWNKFMDWLLLTIGFENHSLLVNVFLFILFIIVVLVLARLWHWLEITVATLDENEERERKAYLAWLKKYIRSQFQNSLEEARLIDIGMEQRVEEIESLFWHSTIEDFEKIFANTERILLLGAPGAGKTTALFRLAKHFHQIAEDDPNAYIPLLFSLSLWGNANREKSRQFGKSAIKDVPLGVPNGKQPTIAEWLVQMLDKTPRTGVSRRVAEKWIQGGRFILFLDGFDEVEASLRSQLIKSLDKFLQLKQVADVKVVICSRIIDYETFIKTSDTQFKLDTTLILQPLTDAQIDSYLEMAQATNLRKSFETDAELRQLANNPLSLNLMIYAYGDGQTPIPQPNGYLSLALRRQHLFDTFIDAMMQREALRTKGSRYLPERDLHSKYQLPTTYSREQVNRYLGWFAARMSERSRTSLDMNNLYSFFREDEQKSLWHIINLANSCWVFLLTFILIISTQPNVSILLDVGEGFLIAITMVILFFYVSWAYKKLDALRAMWADEQSEKPQTITLIDYVIFFSPLWLAILLLSSFIFGMLNELTLGKWGGWALLGLAIIVTNYLLLWNERINISMIQLVGWNFYIGSATVLGILAIDTPNVHISLILACIFIGCTMVIATFVDEIDESNQAFTLAILGTFFAILGSFWHTNAIFIMSVALLPMIFLGKQYLSRLPTIKLENRITAWFITRIFSLYGDLPWNTRYFVEYVRKTLLLKESFQGDEFLHRRLRDHFALRDTILQLSTSSSIQKRRETVHEIIKLKDAGCNLLLELISDSDKIIRQTCIKGLEEIGSAEAAQTLLSIISQTGEGIRRQALNALTNIRDTNAVPILTRAFYSSTNSPDVLAALLLTLGRMRKLAALNDLPQLLVLLQNEDGNVRRPVLEVLSTQMLLTKLSTQELLKLLESEHQDVRLATIQALGELKVNEAVPHLLKLLENEPQDVRLAAIQALGELKANEAVPHLLNLLENEHQDVRSVAIYVLVELNALTKMPIPNLLKLLLNEHLDVRDAVIHILGKIRSNEVLPELLAELTNEQPKFRLAAIQTMETMRLLTKLPVSELLNLLTMEDWFVQLPAAEALGRLGATEAIPKLLQLFKSDNQSIRFATSLALTELNSIEAIPELSKLLDSEDLDIQVSAAQVLISMNALTTLTVPELIILLKNENWSIRVAASRALKAQRGIDALPDILNLLKNKNLNVRSNVAHSLIELGWITKLSVSELMDLLNSENSTVQSSVAQLLGDLQVTEAIPQLLNLLNSKNIDVLATVAQVVGKLQASEAIPNLLSLLFDKNPEVRSAAIQALKELKAFIKLPVSDLLHLLTSEHVEVRSAAIQTLKELKAFNKLPVPDLLHLLTTKHAEVRSAAIQALKELKIFTELPISDILHLLESKYLDVREMASQSVIELKILTKLSVSYIVHLLESKNRDVREIASHALGERKATDVVPNLIELLKSENPEARFAVYETFRSLDVTETVFELRNLFESEDSTIQSILVELLGELKGTEAVLELMRLIKSENWKIQLKSTEVLARTFQNSDTETKISELVKLLEAPQAQVRYMALFLLGEMGDGRTIEEIRKTLNDFAVVNHSINLYNFRSSFGGIYVQNADPSVLHKVCDAAEAALEKIGTPQAKVILNVWRLSKG